MFFLIAFLITLCTSTDLYHKDAKDIKLKVIDNYTEILNKTLAEFEISQKSLSPRTPLAGAKISAYLSSMGVLTTQVKADFSMLQISNSTNWYVNLVWVYYPIPYGVAAIGKYGFRTDAAGNLFQYVEATAISGYISGWTASGSGTTLTIIGQTALLEKQIGIPVFPTTYSLYTWLFLTVNIHVIPPITYLNGYSFDGLGSLVFPQELTFGVISLSSEFLGSGYTCSTYPKNQVQWTNMRAYLSSPEYVMQYTGFNHLPTCGTSNTFQLGYNLDGADITLEGA